RPLSIRGGARRGGWTYRTVTSPNTVELRRSWSRYAFVVSSDPHGSTLRYPLALDLAGRAGASRDTTRSTSRELRRHDQAAPDPSRSGRRWIVGNRRRRAAFPSNPPTQSPRTVAPRARGWLTPVTLGRNPIRHSPSASARVCRDRRRDRAGRERRTHHAHANDWEARHRGTGGDGSGGGIGGRPRQTTGRGREHHRVGTDRGEVGGGRYRLAVGQRHAHLPGQALSIQDRGVVGERGGRVEERRLGGRVRPEAAERL